MPALHRRAVLTLAGGLAAALVGPRRLYAADGTAVPRYANCVKTADGAWAVAVLDEAGAVLRLLPMPDRGHDIAFDPASGRCVAFARRPGSFAVVFDAAGRDEPYVLSAAPGRHFFGHGVFSADGALLYATENDYAAGQGVIGLYDARDGFRRLGEFPSGGLGPHELVWCADGRTLAVANGGLDTTPDAGGRTDLNRAEMKASLSLVDADGGRLLAGHALGPSFAQLSIRHLAVDRTGAVWFGSQHYGDPTELPPLAGRLVPGRDPELFALPEELAPRAKNYVGSVAATADGSAVAFSAPKGGLVFAFEAGSGRFVGSADLFDACGLAPAPDASAALLVTTGAGRVARLSAGDGLSPSPLASDDVAFDNHLVRLV